MHPAASTPARPLDGDSPFRVLADHLPTLCFLTGPDGRVEWCNRRWYDYTGTPPGTDPQEAWPALVEPAMRADVFARIQAAVLSGEPSEMVVLFRGADGHHHPFLTRAEPLRAADGAVQRWLATMTEIGEQWEAEQNGRFLVELSDALRDKSAPADILAITGRMLGRHLGVLRVGYGELEADENRIHAGARGWQENGTRLPASATLDSFGAGLAARLRGGNISVVADTATDSTVGECAATHLRYHILASITVPLVKEGRLAAFLYAHSDTVREWRASEVQLVSDVAERTWATLARARAEAARCESEARLRESEERFRGVIETANEGVWMVDEGGRTLFLNERMAQLLGRPREAVLGRLVTDFFLPGDTAEARQRLARNLAGQSEQFEFRFRQAGGGTLPVLAATAPLWDGDGGIIGAVGMFSDLTDRKLAEEKLRTSEALATAFRDHSPIGMYLKDEGGRYLMINPEMAKVFNRPADQVLGRRADELFGAEEAALIDGYDRQVLATGKPLRVEEFLTDHHEYAWSLVVRFPIQLNQGETGIGGYDIDITDRKRAEEELRQSREALYQSEKLTALGSLLAGVSHELNNPLSVVLTLSELLEHKAAGTPFAQRAARIHAAAARCGRIVQTFLAMARQKAPVRARVDVNAVVAAALDVTGYSLRTAGVQVATRLAPDLPAVEADADQLGQVVMNLLVNAEHALAADGRGDRCVTVRTRTANGGGLVRLEVEDNGPGVPPEIRRRIFDPFFTSKPQGQGTGIGLTFSLGVVEAHGGTIALFDPPGGGAGFVVDLPAAPAAGGGAPDGLAAPEPAARPPDWGRALVIDDERDLADALAELMAEEGYGVDVARSGQEAKALIAENDYAVVLSDLRMPGVDGPELLDWIAANHPRTAKRLAFVTGDTLSPAAARFLERARRPTLEKPFDRAGLRRLLGEIGVLDDD